MEKLRDLPGKRFVFTGLGLLSGLTLGYLSINHEVGERELAVEAIEDISNGGFTDYPGDIKERAFENLYEEAGPESLTEAGDVVGPKIDNVTLDDAAERAREDAERAKEGVPLFAGTAAVAGAVAGYASGSKK